MIVRFKCSTAPPLYFGPKLYCAYGRILGDWADQGALRFMIVREYPVELLREARERSQTKRARSKILIRVRKNTAQDRRRTETHRPGMAQLE